MEEALAFLPLLAIDAALAGGEQSGEPRPGGAVLGPDQERGAVHQIEPAAGDQPHTFHFPLGPQRLHQPADRVAVDDAERRITKLFGRC